MESLGVRPRSPVQRGELAAGDPMPLGVHQWSLIDGLGDHEDSIIHDGAGRIDDQRAGELRVESGTEASPPLPYPWRGRRLALQGPQGAPILIRSHAAHEEAHRAGIPRRDDERILSPAPLAKAADAPWLLR